MDYSIIKTKTLELLNNSKVIQDRLQDLCNYLQQEIPHYDWVGFYFANQENKTLHLGPYAGEAT
ncbi:MAG: GAF domain-containing protein, partial [Flavobacterium sp.]